MGGFVVRRRRKAALLLAVGLLVATGGMSQVRADELDPVLGAPEHTYPDLKPNLDNIFIEGFDTPQQLLFDTWSMNISDVAMQLTAEVGQDPMDPNVTQCVSWTEDHVCREEVPVGGFVFHGENHNHFHFEEFGTYTLRRVKPNNEVDFSPAGIVRISEKVSFCLMDSLPVEDDAQPYPFYTLGFCSAPAVMGISPGWADNYDSTLDGQSFSLEGVSDGRYAIVVDQDYGNRLLETDDTNNRVAAKFTITGLGTMFPGVSHIEKEWPTSAGPPPTGSTTSTTTSTSTSSTSSTSTPQASPPDPPRHVQASAGNQVATVTWDAPADDGGSPVTEYRVSSSPPGWTATTGGNTRSAVLTNLTNGTTYTFSVRAVNAAGASDPAVSNAVTPKAPPPKQGYALLDSDGDVLTYGGARNVGSLRSIGVTPNRPPIGMAYTPTGKGYWIVAQDGGIFSFGDAQFHGSMGNVRLNAPVLGMEPTPSGKGYWLFAGDGGIFSFGDARFFGSMGDQRLAAPVVGMAATGTGRGYWLVARDGGVFAFGDARFHGSMGGHRLNQPVFDMAPTAADKGYWLVARDGGIFAFGDAAARFYGSAANEGTTSVIGMGTTPTGGGYWIADRAGAVFAYGDAQRLGDARGGGRTVVGFAALPRGAS